MFLKFLTTKMMETITNARALHYVFKIGNREANLKFFRDILGMRVLRHEEFKEGCEAQCNGPYDNRWSKTMVGYGPESDFFAMELTYNYGVNSYELGNEFDGILIKSKEALERAKEHNYPIKMKDEIAILTSPDGYKFYISNKPQPKDSDPVAEVSLFVSDLDKSKRYWHEVLEMEVACECVNAISLKYGPGQTRLRLQESKEPINRAQAYGRIAFAVPYDKQPVIEKKVKAVNGDILKPLITLDTPGKATVRVIILADPDCHEICFVDEEGFSMLSLEEEGAEAMIEKYIKKDPFQKGDKSGATGSGAAAVISPVAQAAAQKAAAVATTAAAPSEGAPGQNEAGGEAGENTQNQ